jgi:hypothetical protein
MKTRLRQRFAEVLQTQADVLAFYEAGSASFGRDDEYSDLDFAIIVTDDFEQQAALLIEEIMQSIAPITKKFILPQPTWHGFWQGFYKLDDPNPYLLLDICIIKESAPSYFTEVEMHGTPVIFFDKTGKVGTEHVDMQEIKALLPRRIERIKFIVELLSNFVDKELFRQRLIDAVDLYYGMYLRSLVELLRIKYDPARFSFGCRYLSFALPPAEYSGIKDLFFVADEVDLLNKKERVLAMIKALLEEDLLARLS